ncbi:hypothetical protein [Azospirillum ramasamyi]|uniref:hypothetical protein n=1 Tax=Azospirillum ramasamyi TaxID=682998 RepID=UPI0013A705CC|nr:hypothetical protein [Azospirillum ramasamyi]
MLPTIKEDNSTLPIDLDIMEQHRLLISLDIHARRSRTAPAEPPAEPAVPHPR